MLPRGPFPDPRPRAPRILIVVPATDTCRVCGEEFGFSLSRCPVCKQTFCETCANRRGGLAFCGAACAHAFYFGESDEEDLPEGETEE